MILPLLLTVALAPPDADQIAAARRQSDRLVREKTFDCKVAFDPWKAAINRSLTDRVPLVVMFGAAWCEPCRQLTQRLKDWPVRKDISYVYLDIDDHGAIYRKYGRPADGVPQLVSWSDPRQPKARRSGNYASLPTVARICRDLGIAAPSGAVAAIPSRGKVTGQWTYPGMPSAAALARHLAGPPHNYDPRYLSTLTDRELVTLHDGWHNRQRTTRRRRF